MKKQLIPVVLLGLATLTGCETLPTKVDNAPGRPTTYIDPGTPGPLSGVGVESQDIISMTDKMVRDMLGVAELARANPPARVIVDAKYFKNESSQDIDKNLIVKRLKTALQKSAKGKIQFVVRERADMVEQERKLKRAGKVDEATTGLTKAQAGADYRLAGSINSLDQVRRTDGQRQRFTQITFDLIDLETGLSIWTNDYEINKFSQDDISYR